MSTTASSNTATQTRRTTTPFSSSSSSSPFMPPNNSVPSTDVAAGSGSSMLSSANLVEASFNSGKPWPNPDRPPKSGPQVMRETHVKLTELFKLMLSLNTDSETRERIKNELISLVTKHILTEEQVLYPTVKTVAPEAGEDVNKSVEQETFLKQNLIRLETLRATEDSFHWFAKETFNALQRHMKHEEQCLFPVLKKKLGSEELNNMGELYETIFEVAPTRPIPSSTQKPVTEVCAQPLTVYFEKVRNLASKQRMAMLR